MQTTYGRGHRSARKRETGKGQGNRQLIQLLVCLGVFFAVFIGKGVWPSEVAEAGEYVLTVLRANGDFRAAFSGLGQGVMVRRRPGSVWL